MTISKKTTEYAIWTLSSLSLVTLTYFNLIPTSLAEVAGFLSGALCMWLTIKENIWNWPIGITNSIFFFILFLQAHIYASAVLQVIYIIFAILGWYWWLHGGKDNTKLTVQRVGIKQALILICVAGIFGCCKSYDLNQKGGVR